MAKTSPGGMKQKRGRNRYILDRSASSQSPGKISFDPKTNPFEMKDTNAIYQEVLHYIPLLVIPRFGALGRTAPFFDSCGY